MNNQGFKKIVSTSKAIANLLRGGWKSYEYQDVILPFLVLKRLDTVLEPTKSDVIGMYNDLVGKGLSLDILKSKSGYDFYNTSFFTFEKLLDDPNNISKNLENYIDGFSDNVKDIFQKLEFDIIRDKLTQADLLYRIISKFNEINLHPGNISNHEIGLAFEDLIRHFAEQSNETAGEHYTPRDVVNLMASLLFVDEEKDLKKADKIVRIYDPACGTGGMLTVAKEYIKENINPKAHVLLYGQELNAKTYAIAKADMLMKGEKPDLIKGGEKEHKIASTLSNDQHKEDKFDYIISNPPYGVEWKNDEKSVKEEAERGTAGRFEAGLPAISDGQMIFLQHAISKFQSLEQGGSDAVIITNGSPLFTGDAGSGPSEIRRWMIESDYIDTIIALPESLFFNTGIPTYIWIFSNRKPKEKKGKIQLIDARESKTQLRKNLGNKRFEISKEDAEEVLNIYKKNIHNGRSKILDNSVFGYRAVTIQQPLRLNFQVNEERIERVLAHTRFTGPEIAEDEKDSVKKKKLKAQERAREEKEKFEENIKPILEKMEGKLYKNREDFLKVFDEAFKGIKIENSLKKVLVDGLSERDETADICKKKNGDIEPDKELKDVERVPFGTDIYEYFDKEVKPYVPDLPAPRPTKGQFCIYILKCSNDSFYIGQTANFPKRLKEHDLGCVPWTAKYLPVDVLHWEIFETREDAVNREHYLKTGFGRKWLKREYVKNSLASASRQAGAWIDETVRDHKDGKVGKIGYEIPFTRFFYKYTPPRAVEEIEGEIKELESEIQGILKMI